MKELKISTVLSVFDSITDLGPEEQALCQAATEAIQLSYAAYSGYRVGAAVLMDSGEIIKGANQENAVYPLGICAERVALSAACSVDGGSAIKAIAVTTEKFFEGSELPAFPCGSCRQALVEMESRFDRSIPIYIFRNGQKVYAVATVKDILPFAFDNRQLG